MNTTIIQKKHTPIQSLEQACKEMKLIREGKADRKNWRDMFSEMKKNNKNG